MPRDGRARRKSQRDERVSYSRSTWHTVLPGVHDDMDSHEVRISHSTCSQSIHWPVIRAYPHAFAVPEHKVCAENPSFCATLTRALDGRELQLHGTKAAIVFVSRILTIGSLVVRFVRPSLLESHCRTNQPLETKHTWPWWYKPR